MNRYARTAKKGDIKITHKRACPNCKQELGPKESGHYAPPSLGDEGFYTCEPVGTCANCDGTGEVESSIRHFKNTGERTVPCPTCRRKKEPESPYGYCPVCFAPGKSRERRPNGNDTCQNRHTYPSDRAVTCNGKAARGRYALAQLEAAMRILAKTVGEAEAVRILKTEAARLERTTAETAGETS